MRITTEMLSTSIVIPFLHNFTPAAHISSDSCLGVFFVFFPTYICLVVVEHRPIFCSVYIKTPTVRFTLCELPNLTLNLIQTKQKLLQIQINKKFN
jgi:hypothetical protein